MRLRASRTLPHRSHMQGVDRFDAAAFRLSRAEAMALDPQTRLLLQVTQEALADAGGAGPWGPAAPGLLLFALAPLRFAVVLSPFYPTSLCRRRL